VVLVTVVVDSVVVVVGRVVVFVVNRGSGVVVKLNVVEVTVVLPVKVVVGVGHMVLFVKLLQFTSQSGSGRRSSNTQYVVVSLIPGVVVVVVGGQYLAPRRFQGCTIPPIVSSSCRSVPA